MVRNAVTLPGANLQAALSLHQGGQIAAAVEHYRRLVESQPTNHLAWNLLGVAMQQEGQADLALTYLRKALNLHSGKAAYYNNYGVALRSAGQQPAAQQAFQQALHLSPNYPDALSNLSLVLEEQGQYQEAEAGFRRALDLLPNHRDALFNLANLLQGLGRLQEAIQLYRQVIEHFPAHADIYNNCANALRIQGQLGQAIACYQKALTLDEGQALVHLNLGLAYAEQDQLEQAKKSLARAAQLGPAKSLWRFRHLSLCPTIFQSVQEIADYRAELEAGLEEGGRASLKVDEAELTHDGFTPSFHLAHHGCSNRRLLEKFAALFIPHIHKRRPRLGRGKPRIGFLSTAAHVGSLLRKKKGIIEHLDSDRFQVVVLCGQNALPSCQKSIQRQEIEWVGFPDRFQEAAERVLAAQCDLIYFHKVGADTLGYLLPFARLAPVQCTSWASHYTSGVAQVDYYLSSDLVEAADSQEEYTETLVRLATLPTYEYSPEPILPARRSDFGLPQGGGLYLCPQRLAKFHPAFDELLLHVLDGDPAGHVVLLAGKGAYALENLRRRWHRTLGAAEKRVLVLPTQDTKNFRRLLSVGDVLLDIPQYGASLMAYDAFSVNLPIVTLPGRFKVQRYTQGFYRRMELAGPVAVAAEEYVNLAVRLGKDHDFRHAYQAQLAQRKHLLFEDLGVVREYERFMDQALAGAKES